jgi:hypothetical protein
MKNISKNSKLATAMTERVKILINRRGEINRLVGEKAVLLKNISPLNVKITPAFVNKCPRKIMNQPPPDVIQKNCAYFSKKNLTTIKKANRLVA